MSCKACDLFFELLKLKMSNYGYWLITELFMELHDGKDYCEGGE